MPKLALTDIVLRNLKPASGKQEMYWDAGPIPGFGVRVSGGTRTFVLMVGSATNRQRLSVGRYPVISLAQARQKAKETLAARTLGIVEHDGKDTFEATVKTYLAGAEKRNKPRTVKDYTRLLTRYGFGKTLLSDITPQMIRRKLEALSDRPAERFHAQAVLTTFFRFCHKGYYLDVDPMARMELQKLKSRSRVVNGRELTAIWTAASDYPFGAITRLCILLGQRRSEIAHLEWEWINEAEKLITLPANLTKNGVAHTFPYGSQTANVLSRIPKGVHLFPARRNRRKEQPARVYAGWGRDKAKLDQKAQVTGWVLHDLRRTLSTKWAALRIPQEVTERYINHISGKNSGVAGIYNCHTYIEEMREAVASYERWLASVISSGPALPVSVQAVAGEPKRRRSKP